MKFLIDIPDEHINKNVDQIRYGFSTPEEILKDLLFEHFEWIADYNAPYLDVPEITVTRVDKICHLY